ncbi:MAG: outer membrane protein assembly factor BamD [Bacteroidota bacterium]
MSLIRQSISILMIASALAGSVLINSCASSDVDKNLSAGERFARGKSKFENGDYFEAITELNIVKLQFSGSTIADSAQYFLAECHFKREEYILAGEEYQQLKRNYPSSPLVPIAQFKTGLCYYNLAPKPLLDQKFTARAIDEFQAFIEYYPTNDLAKDAAEKIQELNTRLAQKDYETAELYMKLEYYRAAVYYYNSVFEKYHDTPYGESALLGKVKALIARNHYDEAKPDIEKFLERYPNSKYLGEAQSLQRDIEEHLKSKSAASHSTSMFDKSE